MLGGRAPESDWRDPAANMAAAVAYTEAVGARVNALFAAHPEWISEIPQNPFPHAWDDPDASDAWPDAHRWKPGVNPATM